jgi:hypothetical protein
MAPSASNLPAVRIDKKWDIREVLRAAASIRCTARVSKVAPWKNPVVEVNRNEMADRVINPTLRIFDRCPWCVTIENRERCSCSKLDIPLNCATRRRRRRRGMDRWWRGWRWGNVWWLGGPGGCQEHNISADIRCNKDWLSALQV